MKSFLAVFRAVTLSGTTTSQANIKRASLPRSVVSAPWSPSLNYRVSTVV